MKFKEGDIITYRNKYRNKDEVVWIAIITEVREYFVYFKSRWKRGFHARLAGSWTDNLAPTGEFETMVKSNGYGVIQ